MLIKEREAKKRKGRKHLESIRESCEVINLIAKLSKVFALESHHCCRYSLSPSISWLEVNDNLQSKQ